jgi:signal transduction histidine kinase
MPLRDLPIQQKLRRVFLLTSCAVLSLTCTAFFAYDYFTFRHSTVRQLSTLGKVIASNSTAALAFYDRDAANEILSAVHAEEHIVAVALYDDEGKVFAHYPQDANEEVFPRYKNEFGYYFQESHLVGFEPVVQGERRLGTLFLKSDTRAIYDRLLLYGLIAVIVIALSLLLTYFLSQRLQTQISGPILQLAETAKAVSDRKDYSVRAGKLGNDEIGSLTDAFNHMLARIEEQTEEITLFNQRLEQRVVERTRELQVANKELEAFSYSVSHDLRAPLRSIHGYMKIFSEEYMEQLDDEGRRLVNIILSNGARMGQLIDDLLSFSQLGRKDIRKGRVQMKTLVNEVWTEQLQAESSRNIRFILHDIPTAIADAVTIRQVWSNLISNACKYTMNRDEAIIEIGSYLDDKTVVYFIRDNGAGFEMKYYNKLFGVFQRLHSEEEFSGTGVGLAIVERIISKHGGTVWAESQVNEGTTFFFTLDKAYARLKSDNQ